MSLLLIKLSIEVFCAICKLIGELWWHNAQRFILPIVYSVGVSYVSGCWWLGLTTLPMIAPICLGYKTYGDKDSVARALWLFVITVSSGLGPAILGHEPWIFYALVCIASGFIGAGLRNINNLIGAPINGLIIAFNIWFIN